MQGESPLQRHMGGGGVQLKLVLNVMHDHSRAHLMCTQQAPPGARPNSSEPPHLLFDHQKNQRMEKQALSQPNKKFFIQAAAPFNF